ncbi:MAG: hypothetical protein JNM68_04560 [Dinghuibacter sp.]|nr:hypothetical protein [Dinghuibacter sp.]
MTKEQSISWIFVSLAIASENGPAGVAGISAIADGINHAIPTEEEMYSSLNWLTMQGFVEEQHNRYLLTNKGKKEYAQAASASVKLFHTWNNAAAQLKQYM